jgi:MYXO-CTERM domain-containing protein
VEQRGVRLENVFQVDRVWKGEVGTDFSIDTGGGACEGTALFDGCAILLTVGERYLVFASYIWSTCMPTANLCSGTRLSSGATEAFVQLGASTSPLDGGVAPPAACNDTPCPDAGTAGTSGQPPVSIPYDAGPSGGAGGTSSADASSAGGSTDSALHPTREGASAGCACGVPGAPRKSPMAPLWLSLIALAGVRRGMSRQ